MEVHNEIGGGLLEPIYNEALALELKARGFSAEREQDVFCFYKGQRLEKTYKMDIVVDDIVLELKSVSELCSEHRKQLFNYMRLTKLKIGILLNFGIDGLSGERYGYDEETNQCILLNKSMMPFYD